MYNKENVYTLKHVQLQNIRLVNEMYPCSNNWTPIDCATQ